MGSRMRMMLGRYLRSDMSHNVLGREGGLGRWLGRRMTIEDGWRMSWLQEPQTRMWLLGKQMIGRICGVGGDDTGLD